MIELGACVNIPKAGTYHNDKTCLDYCLIYMGGGRRVWWNFCGTKDRENPILILHSLSLGNYSCVSNSSSVKKHLLTLIFTYERKCCLETQKTSLTVYSPCNFVFCLLQIQLTRATCRCSRAPGSTSWPFWCPHSSSSPCSSLPSSLPACSTGEERIWTRLTEIDICFFVPK